MYGVCGVIRRMSGLFVRGRCATGHSKRSENIFLQLVLLFHVPGPELGRQALRTSIFAHGTATFNAPLHGAIAP